MTFGRSSPMLFLFILSSYFLVKNCKEHFQEPADDNFIGECRWNAVLTGDLLRRYDDVENVEMCEVLCREEEEECRAYTYIRNLRTNPGSCFTRGAGHGPITGFHQKLVVKSGAVSGILDCKTPDSCLKDGMLFSKGFIKELDPIRSLLSCRTSCSTHNDCALYSFFPDKQTCVLRDKNASMDKNIKEIHYPVKVISGILNCPTPEDIGTDDSDKEPARNKTPASNYEGETPTKTEVDGELLLSSDVENETYQAENGYDKEKNEVDETDLENGKEEVGRRGAGAVLLGKKNRVCSGRIPGNIRITEMPIPVGSEAVSYCLDDIRKNTVIRCDTARRLRAWELPDCNSSLLKNTGYCDVDPPSEVVTLPNTTLLPVGGAVVATCRHQTANPTILSCLPDRPIFDSDFPAC